jgi:uncharacterized membrane protein YphA (DoxX/SURF4 family)
MRLRMYLPTETTSPAKLAGRRYQTRALGRNVATSGQRWACRVAGVPCIRLVSMRFHLRRVPERLATGAFILHAGLSKWKGSEQQATGVHGMASAAFPPLGVIPPTRFLRLLAAGEIATGAALLNPMLPDALAGAVLTGFSGALLAMYWRTPTLRKPGSIWPTQAGTAVSKDVWMLGIGVGLLTRP